MIVRIVKLTIQTEKAEQFKIFFHQSHFKIVNFKSWLHLELLKESLNKKFFFTYSLWYYEKCWKNIEILKFLNQFGYKQNYF